ncbi:Uncharacterized protein Adt_36981 [Abeliophyllum distichum]|uniref:Uncharacterized protein n=1 Tax=Abeliophyllum distichum TaxID=126358 RepID=A0ABD1QJ48_9LAMI
MGGHILSLYSSQQASTMKRLTAYVPMSIRRFGHGNKDKNRHGTEERAPSIAEEFERVAEEKSRQGFARHTVDKAQDSTEEAAIGDSTVESLKERYKEPSGKETSTRRGDE